MHARSHEKSLSRFSISTVHNINGEEGVSSAPKYILKKFKKYIYIFSALTQRMTQVSYVVKTLPEINDIFVYNFDSFESLYSRPLSWRPPRSLRSVFPSVF